MKGFIKMEPGPCLFLSTVSQEGVSALAWRSHTFIGSVPSGALIPGSDQSHLWLGSALALELENRCVCCPLSRVSENLVCLFPQFSCGHMENII